VDYLLLVSDASMRGMVAAETMVGMSKELEINVKNTFLIVNRVQGKLTPELQAKADGMGVPLLAALPYDTLVAEFDSQGRPMIELPEDAPMSRAVAEVARKLVG
jgi:CO dehydrogenase maturation factor